MQLGMSKSICEHYTFLGRRFAIEAGETLPLFFIYVTKYDMNLIILLKITLFLPYNVGSTPTAGINMTKPCTSLKTSKSRQVQGFFMLGGMLEDVG